jgi:hypothetical protein
MRVSGTLAALAFVTTVGLAATPARAEDAFDRRLHPVVALEALGANGPERPDLAAGARLSGGVRWKRLLAVWSVEALGPLGAPARQPRFGGLALAGVGIGYAPLADRALVVHASVSIGPHRMQVHDYVDGGWKAVTFLANGARVGVSYRFGVQTPGRSLVPVVGASVTELFTDRYNDPMRGLSVGGETTLAMVSLAAEWSP